MNSVRIEICNSAKAMASAKPYKLQIAFSSVTQIVGKRVMMQIFSEIYQKNT